MCYHQMDRNHVIIPKYNWNITNSKTPADQISTLKSWGCPYTTSGGMYSVVPQSIGYNWWPVCTLEAQLKSQSFI